MRILVTGGAGFIGSHLVDALVDRHEVMVVDDFSSGTTDNLNRKAALCRRSIVDPLLGPVIMDFGPQIVFHLAAQINIARLVGNPMFDASQNIFGSLNLVQCCKECGVEKIIFSSCGCSIYGETGTTSATEEHLARPVSPLGISKLAIEQYLRFYAETYRMRWIALRFSNVYGPRQQVASAVVPAICTRLLRGDPPVIYGDSNKTRDFVYIDDVIAANLLALETDRSGVYNIATGSSISISFLLKMISQTVGIQPKLIYYGPPREHDIAHSCMSAVKVKRELGWWPRVTLKDGLNRTVAWHRQLATKQ